MSDDPPAMVATFDTPTEDTCLRNYDEGARCGRPRGHEGACSQVSRWVTKHSALIACDAYGGQFWSRVTGCTCGWRVSSGAADSDTAYAEHLALASAAEGARP